MDPLDPRLLPAVVRLGEGTPADLAAAEGLDAATAATWLRGAEDRGLVVVDRDRFTATPAAWTAGLAQGCGG